MSLHPQLVVNLLLLLWSICGCASNSSGQADQNEEGEVYRPPTIIPQTPLVIPLPSSTSEDSSVTFLPTSTPACINGLQFLQDLTIPDGIQVAPGEVIDKHWLVENTGTCNWDERYILRLVVGPSLGAPLEHALYPARSGTQAVIRSFFTAPAEPGIYRSAWQAHDPQGQPFGDTIFIEIFVATRP